MAHRRAPVLTAASLEGLWSRVWLRAPGVEDHETRVLWFQGRADYVDLRVPDDVRLMSGVDSLADLDAASVLKLANCEGFAGTIALDGDRCTWRRHINFRGPPAGPDVGSLTFTPEGLMEVGVVADYAELWTRAAPPPAVCRRLRDPAGGQIVIVSGHDAFSFARGHPDTLRGDPLRGRIAHALEVSDRAALAAALDMEFSHGVWEGEEARITLSTDPSRVGDRPFGRADLSRDRVVLNERDFAGRDRTRAWTSTRGMSER